MPSLQTLTPWHLLSSFAPATDSVPILTNAATSSQLGASKYKSYWTGRWSNIQKPHCDKTVSRDLLHLRCEEAQGFVLTIPEVSFTLSEGVRQIWEHVFKNARFKHFQLWNILIAFSSVGCINKVKGSRFSMFQKWEGSSNGLKVILWAIPSI